MRDEFPSYLPDWLIRQRWFAGKGRSIAGCVVEGEVRLEDWGHAELHHLVVRVDYAAGPSERYQLLVGLRWELSQRLEYAVIGRYDDGLTVYDALHDHELTATLLRRIAERRDAGDVAFRRPDDVELQTELPNRLLTVEQSNSSVVFGDTYILKLFRRIAAGLNPDLEISRALALAGSTHVAAPLGWIEGPLGEDTATFGLLQPFYVSATEGWALATTSVRDLYAEGDLHADEVGGDFAAESVRLGAATAEVHGLLATALDTEVAGPEWLAALGVRMLQRFDAAVNVVPDLERFQDSMHAVYRAIEKLPEPLRLQRIHGDYHLGQVLRVDSGWVLLDFEGEPVKPLAERRRPDSALRDVAGMLRSFDYAARFLLAERPRNSALDFRATEWAQRNRAAFCDGYTQYSGSDPRDCTPLLRAYELDKAVYEVVYEARHRPSWTAIPLSSIERLVEQI